MWTHLYYWALWKCCNSYTTHLNRFVSLFRSLVCSLLDEILDENATGSMSYRIFVVVYTVVANTRWLSIIQSQNLCFGGNSWIGRLDVHDVSVVIWSNQSWHLLWMASKPIHIVIIDMIIAFNFHNVSLFLTLFLSSMAFQQLKFNYWKCGNSNYSEWIKSQILSNRVIMTCRIHCHEMV